MRELVRPPRPTCPSLKSKPNNFFGKPIAWLAVTISPRFLSKFMMLLIFFLFSWTNLSLMAANYFSSPLYYLFIAMSYASSWAVSYISTNTVKTEKIRPASQKVAALFDAYGMSIPSKYLILARIEILSKIQ
jgi:hypothetical protein